MKKVLSFCLLLFLLSSSPALAYRHQILNEVLGDATQAAIPVIDPTAEGPGLILPDSPLFFLDQLKQNIRLALAFTPEAKAQVHTQIAGERLAELRFMLAKNNLNGINTDLQGISDNLSQAASAVSQAQFAGKDVSVLAKKINDNIKAKQKALDVLENGTTGTLHLAVLQTQESLFESKVEVEDSLPEDQIQNEVKDDLARRIQNRVEEASNSAELLKSDLAELEKEASQSATNSLKRRQEALENAIAQKDDSLKKVEEKLLENEKKRQEVLLEAQQKAAEEAFTALENAQNAAVGFQKAQQKLDEIQTSTPNSGSSNSNNGSGSSSSGTSGSSGSSGSSGGGGSSGSSGSSKSGGSSGGNSGGSGGGESESGSGGSGH